MGGSGEGGEGLVADSSTAGENRQQERRSTRRRLVQSTLFPHKLPEVESNDDQNGDKECNGDDEDGQGEEYCGSQNKKKRTRKGKTTPATKASRKSPKEKSSANATPKKHATSNGKKNAGAGSLHEKEDASPPPIPNLRLEAKLRAEENSRIFAGKQMHPFFSSWKVGKRCQDTTELEDDCCLAQKKGKSFVTGPIHVFERDQEDASSLDWRNWSFSDQLFSSGSTSLECKGTTESLLLDKVPDVSHSCSLSLIQDEASLDQFICQHEASVVASAVAEMDCNDDPCLFSGSLRKSYAGQQNEHLRKSHSPISNNFGSANLIEDRLWTDKYQPKNSMEVCGNDESVKFLSEWLHSWHQNNPKASKDLSSGDGNNMQDPDYNYLHSDSNVENINGGAILKNVLLITGPVGSGKSAAVYACAKEQGFKVLEANASECRNGAAVKQRLGEALESHSIEWSQGNCMVSQGRHLMKFPTVLPNGEMVKDYDDEVIEVIHLSDDDNSHGGIGTSEKFVFKDNVMSFGCDQFKPLILFEDVDITFPEDRGFIAAMQQISEKAKGPVILTSNCENPVLPDSLDRIEVCFTRPSKKQLLQHVYTICSVEKANIQPHLAEKFIECCQRDIRKTIIHLQFWCQGKQLIKGGEQRLSSPTIFDPEAGHWLLPKLMPWHFPSLLSELVEKEISKSLSLMEEKSLFTEGNEEEIQYNLEMHIDEKDIIEAKKEAMLSRNGSEGDWNDFATLFDADCDLISSIPVSLSGKKSRRKLAVINSSDSEDESFGDRIHVTSAKDTENGSLLELERGFPSHSPSMQNSLSPSADTLICSEVKKQEENHYYQGSEMAIDSDVADTLICSEVKKQEENHYYQGSEMAIDSDVKETSILADVSCVPESSFITETEVKGGTEGLFGRFSSRNLVDIAEEVTVSNVLKQDSSPVEVDNLDRPTPELPKDFNAWTSPCNVIAVPSHEEVEDSQNDHNEATMREYPVMDEGSCIDLNKKSEPPKKPSSCLVMNSVQDSWRKLRDCHTDLRHAVASEHRDTSTVIELAYGLSNLISEAELLLTKCQTLDSLELSVAHCKDSYAFGLCDEQLKMASMIGQHGFWCYAKGIAAVSIEKGYDGRVDLACEMPSTASMMEVGCLFGQEMTNNMNSHARLGTVMSLPESELLLTSGMKPYIFNILKSIVPSRSCLTVKGHASHEYFSSLAQIARSEVSRLSESTGHARRWRGRATRNYLSTGSLMLSPEEVTLLQQSNIYGKFSSRSTATLADERIT